MAERAKFPKPHGVPNEGNPEFRSAVALEFIAYYLDRIEDHLAQGLEVAKHRATTEDQMKAELVSIRSHLAAQARSR
jgi:hypothetical protein